MFNCDFKTAQGKPIELVSSFYFIRSCLLMHTFPTCEIYYWILLFLRACKRLWSATIYHCLAMLMCCTITPEPNVSSNLTLSHSALRFVTGCSRLTHHCVLALLWRLFLVWFFNVYAPWATMLYDRTEYLILIEACFILNRLEQLI